MISIMSLIYLIGAVFDYKLRKVPLILVAASFISIILTQSIPLIALSILYFIVYIMNNNVIKVGYIDFNLMLFLGYTGLKLGIGPMDKWFMINLIAIVLSIILFIVYKYYHKEKKFPMLTLFVPELLVILMRGIL